MLKTIPLLLLLALTPALLAACGQEEPKPAITQHGPATPVVPETGKRTATGEPEHIVIDHILIMVKSPAAPNARYADPAEAKAVAYRLLDELKNGADWKALKKANSEDGPPGRAGGPYAMANLGVRAHSTRSQREFERTGMVPAFGDVGFALEVGEIGIADYDPAKSKYGYHIIKRIK